MTAPYALFRAGFPYAKTIGTKRLTNRPKDLALGKDGRMYLLTWEPIQIMSMDEEDLGAIGIRARGDDPIDDPSDVEGGALIWAHTIIVDQAETLYVSDEIVHRISIFSKDGAFLGKWGEHGDGDGQLDRPSGIAFDADENIYVVDSMNHRVQKFTKEGVFLMNWGCFGDGDGELNMPWGIAVDADGDVYVSDWRNDRIQRFTADGEFVFKFGTSGTGPGELNRPMGVAVDKDFDVYVVDTHKTGIIATADDVGGRVQLFSREGRYVQSFFGDSTVSKSAQSLMWTSLRTLRLREMTDLEQEKRFRNPRSVVVDDEGRMFVPDYGAYRVQVYQKEAYPLKENEIGPVLRVPSLSAN